MRAIAVMLVVLFHAHLPPAGGFLGVDVFFAISGYLITGLLVAERQKTGKIDFISFYARRARRLIPAAFVLLTVALVFGYFLYGPQEMTGNAKAGASAFAYISNYYFAFLPNDYFSPELGSNLFLHTWSLSVEEQFYLFWPLLILLGLTVFKTAGKLRWALLGVTLLSLALCLWAVSEHPRMAFYSLPTRAWQFALGGFVRLTPVPRMLSSANMRALVGIIGLAILTASVLMIDEMDPFPSWNALAPMAGALLLLWTGEGASKIGPAALLHAPFMQWIGKRSYSLYLWHWPIFLLLKSWFVTLGAVEIALGLALTFALAHLSYVLVENPIRHMNLLRKTPRLSIVMPFASAGIGVAISLIVFLGARDMAAKPQFFELQEAKASTADQVRADCFVWPQTNAEVKQCDFNETENAPRIVLAGDSHAFHFFHGMKGATESLAMNFSMFVKGSCPIADIDVFDHRLRRNNPACSQWRQGVLEKLESLQPDLVIVAQNTLGYIPSHIGDPKRRRTTTDEWKNGVRSVAQRLDAAGIEVVFLHDTPMYDYNVLQCLARARRQGRSSNMCGQPQADATVQAFDTIEKEAISGIPTASYEDANSEFCSNGFCSVEDDEHVFYIDKSHISDTKSEAMSDYFAELIERHLSK